LTIAQLYHVSETQDPDRGRWKVSTAEYNYTLRLQDRRVLIAYHWHPGEQFRVRTPHLHIGPGALLPDTALHRTHVPTGRVAIEDVIRFAINELGVEPEREDWRQILDETQGRYEKWRTWSGSGPRPPED
jgi:hypothetical protein